MARTRSEKTLTAIVIILSIGFGGIYIYRNVGEDWLTMQEGMDDRIAAINTLIAEQKKAAQITTTFEEMEQELKLEGSDPEQLLKINEDLARILEEVGLKNQYSSILPKDPQREEDFKIVAITIDRIVCTPEQFGRLLYQLEKESKVMEITNCRVSNLMNEVGSVGISMGRAGVPMNLSPLKGLLSVNLEISRLIEYRPDEIEENKKNKRRRS